jgi:Putative adhesin
METYETPGPVHLRLRLTAGEIEVRTTDTDQTTVEIEVIRGDRGAADQVRREASTSVDGGVVVRVEAPERRLFLGREPVFRFLVTTPHGAHLEAAAVSGSIRTEGALGAVGVKNTAGEVSVDRADGDASATTASGSIRFGSIGGNADLRSISGSVRVDRVGGSARIHSVSGSLELGELSGSVDVETVSGRIEVAALGGGQARLRSISGRVRVAVRPGLRVWMDLSSLSGRTTSDLQPDTPHDAEP